MILLAVAMTLSLDSTEASRFAKLALKCVRQEYPNKLDHVMSGAKDVLSPKTLHPSFYGCYDWHSSVHGHWMLVRVLSEELRTDNIAVNEILPGGVRTSLDRTRPRPAQPGGLNPMRATFAIDKRTLAPRPRLGGAARLLGQQGVQPCLRGGPVLGRHLLVEEPQRLFQRHGQLEVLHVDGLFQQSLDGLGGHAALLVVGLAADLVALLTELADRLPRRQRRVRDGGHL